MTVAEYPPGIFNLRHIVRHDVVKGGGHMYGETFGGYTRWAVVFLIIFVLFFLLVPGAYGYRAGIGAGATPVMGAY